MTKKILLITVLALLLGLYLSSELNKKREFNWELNFSGISREPFGCFVLRNTLEKNDSLGFARTINKTYYQSFPQLSNKNTKTVIVITDEFSPDSLDLSVAYKFVADGNNMFISSYTFGKDLADSLKFKIDLFSLGTFTRDKDTCNLVNPELKSPKPVAYDKMDPSRFSAIDTAKHLVLGTGTNGKANFIRVKYGRGFFYLHTQPKAFTNFFILYSNSSYPYKALSYIKNTTLVWDDYYKPFAGKYNPDNDTPFRYLLSESSLRVALYLTLLIIFVYFLIGSKRRQRFIPIYEPPANSTLGFVGTISRLYQGQPDYKKMAIRKLQYLKEMVYSKYGIKLDEQNENSALAFAGKSGFDLNKTKEIFSMAMQISSQSAIGAGTLVVFSKKIDAIYQFESMDNKRSLLANKKV
jgi:hypothetical protein